MINWFMEINEIGHIDHFYTPYTSNPSAHYVAGELSWLERGIHKPEVGSSILLPATNNISNLQNLINNDIPFGVHIGVYGSYF